MKRIILFLTLLCSITGCDNTGTSKQYSDKELKELFYEDSVDKYNKSIIQDSLDAKNERLKADAYKNELQLKKNFICNTDKFNSTTWYLHKKLSRSNRLYSKYLMVHIGNAGYKYLESQYCSSDWLFHSKIKVLIEGKVYESEEVPTSNDDNKSDNSSGHIWENVSYTGGKDNGIMQAIENNIEKEITVRFIGRQYVDDIKLSKSDKLAIKESCLLAHYIEITGK